MIKSLPNHKWKIKCDNDACQKEMTFSETFTVDHTSLPTVLVFCSWECIGHACKKL